MGPFLIFCDLFFKGVASQIANRNFMEKIGFNLLIRHLNSQMFVNSSLYNFMWNLTDPILPLAQQFRPEQVPSLNIGVLATVSKKIKNISKKKQSN